MVDNAVAFLLAFLSSSGVWMLKSWGERRGNLKFRFVIKFILWQYHCTSSERPDLSFELQGTLTEVLLTIHSYKVAQVVKSMCGI